MKLKIITKQSGLTIIEVMVAVTIGLIILSGVAQIYISNKQTYRATEGMSRLQENGRFASYFMMKDIRSVGYQGCKKRKSAATNFSVTPASYIYDQNANLSAINSSDGSETLASGDSISPLTGSDVLSLQTVSRCGVLTATMSGVSGSLAVSDSCGIKNGEYFIVSDCQSSDVALVSNSDPVSSPITHVVALSKAYSIGADFLKVESVTYYVANNADGIPALMRRNNIVGLAEELVEDIDDLQFLYGEDTNGDGMANRYIEAPTAGVGGPDMGNVVSVRMTFSARTATDNLAFNAVSIPSGGTDRRVRKTFSTTIAIRNK